MDYLNQFKSSFKKERDYRDYEVASTQRGRPKLIHKGFSFTAHTVYKDDPYKYWYCDQRWKGCKVRGVLSTDGRLSLRGFHNHRPKKPSVLMVVDSQEAEPADIIFECTEEDV